MAHIPPVYPLPSRGTLAPAWRDPGSRVLAGTCLAAAAIALALHGTIPLTEVDDVVLHVTLPAALAFVLAFAPRPGTHVGRLSRAFTVLGLAASVLVPAAQPVLLVCYPLLLVAAVAIGGRRSC